MKKSYIVVTPFFPTPESFRGPFVYDQVKAIKECSDYEVFVFKPTSFRDKTDSYDYDGIKVILFRSIESPSYLFNGMFNGINANNFVNRFKSIGISIDSVAAVHCHTSSFGAYGLALKKLNPNIKVLLQHHDKDPFTILNGKFANWKLNSCYRAKKNIKIFNEVDYHVCISEACRDNLIAFPKAAPEELYNPYLSKLRNLKELPSIYAKHIVILYNGVNTSKFYRKPLPHRDCFVIGCVANYISLKGHADLLQAFAKFIKLNHEVKTRLKLVGSGPTKIECENLARQLGIDKYVEFCHEVKHEELNDFYNSLDLFVLPSHFDGFGCVCLEAYSCGVPFVICKNQGASEYYLESERERWSFTPGNIDALSEIIDGYFRNRWSQSVKYPLDINILVSEFLKDVGL